MTMYYILSLKWSKYGEPLTWWRPSDSGYTTNLKDAGLYSQLAVEARPDYYNNKVETLAVSEGAVESLAQLQVLPTTATMAQLGAARASIRPAEIPELRERVQQLEEFAWHSNNSCNCEVCRKTREAMDAAANGG